MTRERFDFDNFDGQRLAGLLELPDDPPRAFALFAHCFTCSKDIAAASRISRALVADGIAVLRFDFTGLGNSDGDFANTNFSSNVQDLVAAAEALGREHEAPSLLIGHSLGGAAVLAAASDIESAVAVATIGAPADPTHVQHLFAEDLETIEREGRAKVTLAGREFTIAKQFVDDLHAHSADEQIRGLKKALLIMHSPIDELVSVDEARKIFEAARHPKSFVSLDDADHLLTRPRDSAYVARTIAAWASRYIGEAAPAESNASSLPPGEVRVRTDTGKFAQRVTMGAHELIGDEPEKVGGDDRGPTPYDLLLAALGTCTSMTLSMYARRKSWPLESVTVDLKHERIHAKDCEECEEKDGKIERITRTLTMTGPLDEAQKERLVEIADKCPVHRTLEGHPKIVTKRG